MVTTGTFVKPDSVLARTAREMLAAHAGGAGPRDGMIICPVCGDPLPCASGRAAAEVLFAAGLAESSGLIEAARQGLGPQPGSDSPFGLPSPSATESDAHPSRPQGTDQVAGLAAPDADRSSEPAAGVVIEPAAGEPGGRSVPVGAAPASIAPPSSAPTPFGPPSAEPRPSAPPMSAASSIAEPAGSEPSGLSGPRPAATPASASSSALLPDPDEAPSGLTGIGPAAAPSPEIAAHEAATAVPAGDEPSGLSFSVTASSPPAQGSAVPPTSVAPIADDDPTGDVLSGGVPAGQVHGSANLDVPSGDAGFRDLPPAGVPDPADDLSGRKPAVPVREPEPQVPEEIDPLLLGPPLFDQQNRPLDAPQFPRSPRPDGSVASPLEGLSSTPGTAGPASEPHGDAQGSAANQVDAEPHMGGEAHASGHAHAGGPAHGSGRPSGNGEPHAGQSSAVGQPDGAARPSAGDVSYVSSEGERPADSDRGERSGGPADESADSAFLPRAAGTAGLKGPTVQSEQATGQAQRYPVPGLSGAPSPSPSSRPGRAPLEAPQMGQLNRPLETGPHQPSAQQGPGAEQPPSGLQIPQAKPMPSGLPAGHGSPSGLPNHPLTGETATDQPTTAGHGTPSGLPNRPAPHTPAAQTGEGRHNPAAAPSGLPGLGQAQNDATSGPLTTHNPAQPAWSETQPTDGAEPSSGLPPGPADN